jgi:hypothetical protein
MFKIKWIDYVKYLYSHLSFIFTIKINFLFYYLLSLLSLSLSLSLSRYLFFIHLATWLRFEIVRSMQIFKQKEVNVKRDGGSTNVSS